MGPLKRLFRSQMRTGWTRHCSKQRHKGTNTLLLLGCTLLYLPLEVAEAATKPDFRISVKALRIVQFNTETSTTENGATTKDNEDSTALETFPDNIELAAFMDNWAIYTYPGQSSASLMVGYSGWSGFEVGPLISVRYSKRTTKTDGTTTASSEGSPQPGSPDRNSVNLGAYVFYGQPLGTTAAWVIETTLAGWYGLRSGSETSAVPGPSGGGSAPTSLKAKLESTSMSFAIEANLAVALADKFEYAPGIGLSWTSETSKGTRQTGSTYDSDATTLAWELSLAKFRYTF